MTCPGIFKEFLDHLYPNKDAQAYVLNYMHLALTTRNGNNTALCLVGKKGTGKGLFVDLFKELVGPHNFNKAHRGFFDSGFNRILLNKQLIHIDEQPINTAERIDRFKDYCNNEHNIEKKGVDADRTVETFFQFIVTVNRDVDIKVDQDDRRFSIVDITHIPLRKERGGPWNDAKIERFVQAIHDVKQLRAFGNFILDECRDERWGTEDAYMGSKFNRLVEVSLWEWQKFVLDIILRKSDTFYNLDRIKLMYKEVRTSTRSSISRDLTADFLNNYRHEGHVLGTVGRDEDKKWGIIPGKSFRPKGADDDEKVALQL